MQLDEKLTDTVVIHRILNGEKALYELIVRRFNSYLYKVGRSYNFNHEDTQDIMQDTYVDAFRSLAQFGQHASFKTWLIRIMLNHCYHKKQKFSFRHEYTSEKLNEYSRPMFNTMEQDANKQIFNRELGHVIELSLAQIPEDYRLVFSLREMNGLNVNETAELLHITPGNVKVRLNRAKSMLRKEIEKTYSASELYEFNLIYCDAMVDRVIQCI